MKIGLYINLNRDIDGTMSKRFIEYLKDNNVEYMLIERNNEIFPTEEYYSKEEVLNCADVIAVFGGDGTILGIAVDCAKKNIPMFGINVGNLGFLSEVLPSKMFAAIDCLLKGNYYIENRELIEVGCKDKVYYAVNEVLLNRDSYSRIMKIDVSIDGILADSLRADGVLVSTPTGSTAYSMASGGPILSPDVKAFIVNSICPHSLNTRPIVISSDSVVTLHCDMTENNKGVLVVDGKVVDRLDGAHDFDVKKADFNVKFVRFEETNFYNRLLSKMNTWIK